MNSFIKKFFAIILTFILFATQGSFVFAKSEESNNTSASLAGDTAVSLLPNVYAKMRAEGEKTIKIGYFGGSVTNGYGTISDRSLCWRERTTSWLNEAYGDTFNVTFAETREHAGAGGTGTALNVFRAEHALELDTDDPIDLLFIEFAINDAYKGESYDKAAYYMESIIQIVRNKAPECDIVIVLTTDSSRIDTEFVQAKAHADVAAHYGIPVIWLGKYMTPFMISEKAAYYNAEADAYITANPDSGITTREEYFAANNIDITKIKSDDSTKQFWLNYYKDSCHPHEVGYGKYFEFLRDNLLKENLDTIQGCSTAVKNYTLPETNYNTTQQFADSSSATSVYYNAPLRTDAHEVFVSGVQNAENNYGFSISTNAMTSTTGGASFRAVFSSKTAGIHTKGATTGGILLYSVDGGEYKYFNLYHSDNSRDNIFLFYDGLETEQTHTVDVILRTGKNGTTINLEGFFVDGDSDRSGVSFGEIPNSTPLPDIYNGPVVLTPSMLNTYVGSNPGVILSLVHNAQDIDVIRFTPDTSSTGSVKSDCYNSTLKTVSIPTYKYAVISYFYDVQSGNATAEGNRQHLRVYDEGRNPFSLPSADTIVKNTAATSIFDLTAMTALGAENGIITQIHLSPFGEAKGNQFTANEFADVANVTFYAEYPYSTAPIEAAVSRNISSSAETVSLDGKKVLPSAFPYAKIKYSYSGNTSAGIKLDFDGIYNITTNKNDINVSVTSKAIKNGTNNEIIVNLAELATCGASRYLENVKLSADIADGEALTVESITFYTSHPDPNALCDVIFDANGGTGTLPESASAKIGSVYEINAGASLTKNELVFIGWNTDKNATTALESVVIPEDGVTLYAVYKAPVVMYLAADGSVTDQSVTYTENVYTSVRTAISAAGADPVKIIFGGDVSLDDISSAQNTSDSPLMIFHGADGEGENPTLKFTKTQTHLYSNTVFENLTVVDVNNKDGYFNTNGKNLTIGTKGQNDVVMVTADGTADHIMPLMCGGNLIVNSGTVTGASPGYEASFSNNASITINGGTVNSIRGGVLTYVNNNSSYTLPGNITLTFNGGVFDNTNPIRVSHSDSKTTTITGASTLIANNGIIDTYNLTIREFKYVINSAAGGTVSLHKEGSSTTAPTFKIEAKNATDKIYINGALQNSENGVVLFTPVFVEAQPANTAAPVTYAVTYEATGKVEVSTQLKLGRKPGNAPVAGNLLKLEITDSTNGTLLKTIALENESSVTDADGYISVNISDDVSGVTAENLTVRIVKNGYAPYEVTTTAAMLAETITNMLENLSEELDARHGDIKGNTTDYCGDGKIDIDDFVRVIRGFNASETEEYNTFKNLVDLNEDGNITVSDLEIIKKNFGYGNK